MVRVDVIGYKVATFLGRRVDMKLQEEHVPLVMAFARAYTRGRGFSADGTTVEDDLAAVVISATARLTTNPAQLEREHAGEYIAVGSFAGWTLPELAVLHRYRRRTA